MPGRISRASVPSALSGSGSTRQKGARKRKQRGLNAYAIAEQEEPGRTKVKQHRLGEAEGEEPRRKKQRLHGDDEDEDIPHPSEARRTQQKKVAKGQQDDLDMSNGSDSEGLEFKLGEVDVDDDSDIDSEEAFGDSDEEKFEGFSFGRSGSASTATRTRNRGPAQQESSAKIDLDESDPSGEMVDDDDLGEDAVDLAAMLDDSPEASDEETSKIKKGRKGKSVTANDGLYGSREGEGEGSEYSNDQRSEGSREDEQSGFSMSDDEPDDKHKQRELKNMIAAFSKPSNDTNEPSGKNATPTLASALAALRESSGLDPAFEKEVKNLSRNLQSSKDDKRNNLVQAPLPKRQQDRIERKAAYGKAKETLNRWIDTVKHNRRAEHLVFPLQDPHGHELQGAAKLAPTSQGKPRTDLEQAIQGILEQSGLGNKGDQQREEEILQGFEESQTKKMPLEEVLARRAELRKARELLFREEVRAKRIKKIKSKAYRRVHRKEAAKAAQKERDLLAAAGIEPSDDEKEANDRRRAEARMDSRHRDSRWAKGVKQSGRAAWDENARDAVTEMARRNEELRQRMEGKEVQTNEATESDLSSEEDDDEDSFGADDGNQRRKLQKQLDKVTSATASGESKLGSLGFMQRADAARRQRNDEETRDIRRDLAGDETGSEDEVEVQEPVARKKFGPTEPNTTSLEAPATQRNEFEEPEERDDSDDEQRVAMEGNQQLQRSTSPPRSSENLPKSAIRRHTDQDLKPIARVETKAFMPQVKFQSQVNGHGPNKKAPSATKANLPVAPNNMKSWKTVQFDAEEHEDEIQAATMEAVVSEESNHELIPSNSDLVRAAFGGDDVEAAFAAEKASAESSEDEKVTDNTLPGWGSWTGDGISKREQKRIQERNKGRSVTKREGVKPGERKDKGKERVIISEKRAKKNAKYMAPNLPHPFESRQQYERSIRQPVGPEWTTKETFQNATKPRVLVKRGARIEPMSTPMV